MTNEYNWDFPWIKLIQQTQQVKNKKLKQIKSKRIKKSSYFSQFLGFQKNVLKN